MSLSSPGPSSPRTKDGPLFRWACLLVAVIALAVYGWMLNDMRLEVKGVAPKVEKLADRAELLIDKVDKQLPRILTQAEQVAGQLDRHLPEILANSETAADNLSDLSENFKQYKGLMGAVHTGRSDKAMLAYGTSLLNFLGEQNATIGVRKPVSKQPLQRAVPAKQWASGARKDVHFLSLVARTKEEMLHGLARSRSLAPWYIQLGDQAPRLLADWLKEAHPDSRGVS